MIKTSLSKRIKHITLLLVVLYVVCFVKTIHDYDSDHGHRYDWNRQDLYFNVSVFGIVSEMPALPYIEKELLLINEEEI